MSGSLGVYSGLNSLPQLCPDRTPFLQGSSVSLQGLGFRKSQIYSIVILWDVQLGPDLWLCVCVCVCVCRERERERQNQRKMEERVGVRKKQLDMAFHSHSLSSHYLFSSCGGLIKCQALCSILCMHSVIVHTLFNHIDHAYLVLAKFSTKV